MNLISKIFGDANDKYLNRLKPTIEKINSFEPETEKLGDSELKSRAVGLKEKIKNGENPDLILAEAFALVRESAKRTLSQRHFDVQLMGGIVLNQGKIAEMKTGEGKTLTATLAMFLNGLEGKGSHLITVNEYLAKRDTVWMGQVYYLLGLATGCITGEGSFIYDPDYGANESGDQPQNSGRDKQRDETGGFKVIESYLRPCSKKAAYLADITYGTASEFGFDYLRDNMVYDLSQRVQRGFNYAIVDEVDSVLIDEARTPLIISRPDSQSSKWYSEFAAIIPRLKTESDYKIDEKRRTAVLTEEGINKLEKILGLENIYEAKGIRYLHYLEQALRAETLFKKDKDYVVKNNEIVIVDEFTGRLLSGRRYSGGLHQAIEAKEKVRVQEESLTLATITYQNFFRMYKKLAGMTGTAATSAEEFDKVYNLDVVIAPTNKPMVRADLPDKVFKSEQAKLKSVVEEIKKRHNLGQPVLVGTVSIEKNELLSKYLALEGVSHEVLNAKQHQREAQIIAQAGRFKAVTVATNMAGRGVDIVLGGNPPDKSEAEKVVNVGGLYVIGTERHEARRIDNQLRGRSGRQGDPGSSRFFVSFEDELMRRFGGDRMKSIMETLKIPESEAIENKMLSNIIEEAQNRVEGFNFDARKHLLEYDDVKNKHRETFYKKRQDVLRKTAKDSDDPDSLALMAKETLEKNGYSLEQYQKKEETIGKDNMRQLEKAVFLMVMDGLWLEHLENMEHLEDSVRLRAYGQQDPLVEYKTEGHKAFQRLMETMETEIAAALFKFQVSTEPKKDFGQPLAQPVSGRKEPGRNDPCPCGAVKADGHPVKYKHCHGKN